eukprot:4272878-Pleurochrysis_carterae.AAC.2
MRALARMRTCACKPMRCSVLLGNACVRTVRGGAVSLCATYVCVKGRVRDVRVRGPCVCTSCASLGGRGGSAS